MSGSDPVTDPTLEPQAALEVRRNAPLAAAVGVAASVIAIAYLGRAAGSGALLDWTLCGVLAALAVVHLLGFLDSRAPLLVADELGVRIRLGRTWQGVPWADVERVELTCRRGLLRDGALAIHPRDEQAVLAGLDAAGRRRAGWSRRLRGAAFSVPLTMSTRLATSEPDEPDAVIVRLVQTAGAPVDVVVDHRGARRPVARGDLEEPEAVGVPSLADAATLEPVAGHDAGLDDEPEGGHEAELEGGHDAGRRPLVHDLRPGLARGIGVLASRLPRRRASAAIDAAVPVAEQSVPHDESASQTPDPSREPVAASRAEVLLHDEPSTPEVESPGRELRRPGSVSLVEDTVLWVDRESHATRPVLIDDLAVAAAVEPASDPVIGPELAAARTRLGLSVDQLADRTRIRPHVIESIEVDDFAPCGGDFYARGHLRTLARVLGLDVGPLLAYYDERYADAEISPRRVFEAELAGGPHGPIRGTRGGPNWSVLVAAVMALVLVWSVARLLTDGPVAVDDTPALNGSPGLGLSGSGQKLAEPVPVVLTAAGGGAHVVVRDGGGRVVFTGDVAFGDSRELKVSPPVRVQSSDGSLEVSLAGQDHGPLGATGEPAQNTFLAP